MADVFQEVDEALKQDRILKLWEDNKFFIIGCVVMIVLVTAVSSGYRSWEKSSNEADTKILMEAIEQQEDLIKNLENVYEQTNVNETHRAIALFIAAGEHLKISESDEALNLYSKVAEDESMPEDLRDYAILMKASLVSEGSADSEEDAKEVLDILNPLINKPSGMWYSQALLKAAVINAHIPGNLDTAIKYTSELVESKNVPGSLRNRAVALKSVYESKKEMEKPVE